MSKHKKADKTWSDISKELAYNTIFQYAKFRRTPPEEGNVLYLEYELATNSSSEKSEMRVFVGRLRNLVMHNIPELEVSPDNTIIPRRVYFKPYQFQESNPKKISKQMAKDIRLEILKHQEENFKTVVGRSERVLGTYRKNPESPEAEHSLLELIDRELKH